MAASDDLTGKTPDIITAVGQMRKHGLPFDVPAQMFIDPKQAANEISIRVLIGEPPTMISTIAVLVLAYYFPEVLSLPDGSEEE